MWYKDVSSVARTNHQCAKSPTAYISDKGQHGSISTEKFHKYALNPHPATRVAIAAGGLLCAVWNLNTPASL